MSRACMKIASSEPEITPGGGGGDVKGGGLSSAMIHSDLSCHV